MVAFFAIAGVEMRREMLGGELRSWRHAAPPVVAAITGMAIPAAIFAVIVHGDAGSRGWGIPMATDVAFALGALAVVAPRSAPRLRVFLLTLAVADDIASIVVLVFFYSTGVRVAPLVGALACIAAMITLARSHARSTPVLLALAALAWWGLVHAHVEAAVVGVVVGLLVPSGVARDRAARRRLRAWDHALQPAVTLIVLPLFALANTGVTFRGSRLGSSPALLLFVAVVAARIIGKPLGIAIGASLARRATAQTPPLARGTAGVGALAAVGFTVPLLITRAALPPGSLRAAATTGLLVGSVGGALLGAALLRRDAPEPRD